VDTRRALFMPSSFFSRPPVKSPPLQLTGFQPVSLHPSVPLPPYSPPKKPSTVIGIPHEILFLRIADIPLGSGLLRFRPLVFSLLFLTSPLGQAEGVRPRLLGRTILIPYLPKDLSPYLRVAENSGPARPPISRYVPINPPLWPPSPPTVPLRADSPACSPHRWVSSFFLRLSSHFGIGIRVCGPQERLVRGSRFSSSSEAALLTYGPAASLCVCVFFFFFFFFFFLSPAVPQRSVFLFLSDSRYHPRTGNPFSEVGSYIGSPSPPVAPLRTCARTTIRNSSILSQSSRAKLRPTLPPPFFQGALSTPLHATSFWPIMERCLAPEWEPLLDSLLVTF